ncbi:unnamed protein product [Ascophyllum nodosum]
MPGTYLSRVSRVQYHVTCSTMKYCTTGFDTLLCMYRACPCLRYVLYCTVLYQNVTHTRYNIQHVHTTSANKSGRLLYWLSGQQLSLVHVTSCTALPTFSLGALQYRLTCTRGNPHTQLVYKCTSVVHCSTL